MAEALKIEEFADRFRFWANQTLDKLAAAKKKKKTKLDPKAKVRNRGTVCVPASSAKDKKDHFPINNIGQARNALARVHQYSTVPSWYKGSLKGLQALVSRKVHSKYPAIKSDKKSKKSSSQYALLRSAQGANQTALADALSYYVNHITPALRNDAVYVGLISRATAGQLSPQEVQKATDHLRKEASFLQNKSTAFQGLVNQLGA